MIRALLTGGYLITASYFLWTERTRVPLWGVLAIWFSMLVVSGIDDLARRKVS